MNNSASIINKSIDNHQKPNSSNIGEGLSSALLPVLLLGIYRKREMSDIMKK